MNQEELNKIVLEGQISQYDFLINYINNNIKDGKDEIKHMVTFFKDKVNNKIKDLGDKK
jgi:hypothetical protein